MSTDHPVTRTSSDQVAMRPIVNRMTHDWENITLLAVGKNWLLFIDTASYTSSKVTIFFVMLSLNRKNYFCLFVLFVLSHSSFPLIQPFFVKLTQLAPFDKISHAW